MPCLMPFASVIFHDFALNLDTRVEGPYLDLCTACTGLIQVLWGQGWVVLYMCAFAWARSGCCFIEFRHYRASVMPANIYLTGPLTNGLIKSSQHCEWISVVLPQYFMIRYRHLPPYYRLRELQSQTETFHQGNSLHLMRCFAEMQGYIFTCKIDNIWQILAMKKKKTRRAKDYLHKEQCAKTILYENC